MKRVLLLTSWLGLLAFALPARAAAPTTPQCLDSSEQGQAARDGGKLSRARELFVTCAAASCPGPVRASCSKWLQDVVDRTPSIVIVVRDETDHDVAGASVAIDGAPRVAVSGTPLPFDPGTHALVVSAAGYQDASQSIVASVGEKNRIVKVRLARAAAPPVTPHAEPLPAKTEPAKTEPATAEPAKAEPAKAGVPVVPIVLGGVAAVSLGASLVIGLGARGDAADLRESPCGVARTCAESASDGIESRLLVADVLLGVSIAAAAAAVIVWLAAPSSASAKRAAWIRPAFEF